MSQPPDRTDPTNLFDPFGLWKQTQQAMLESWSKSMTDAVSTGQYAETTGRMLDTYLTISAPMRKMFEQTMTQLLNLLSLPSRAEVVSLAERMTNIELRLDDLDARLDDIQRGVERTASAVAALGALITRPTSDMANAEASNATRTNDRSPARKRDSRATGPATTRATRATRATSGTATAQPRAKTQ
jgi:hypothetical protein